MKNIKSPKSLGIIFMIVGLIGSIFVLITSPVSGPLIELSESFSPILFILYIPLVVIPGFLSFVGVNGCNVKTDGCVPEFFTGLLLNIIVFYLLGYLIGLIFFRKNK